jgi:putative zinc finger/helix-turn-helix YgiT family protein
MSPMNKEKLHRRGKMIEEVRKCFDCDRNMRGKRTTYQYTECGLNSVKLANVPVFECECGAKVPEIPDIEGLHMLIAVAILQKNSLLSGDEIRFLRKSASLSQSELAKIVGVHSTRVSKWESDDGHIGKNNDRLLRAYCLFGMIQQILSGSDGQEMVGMLTAAKFIRTVDVRKIFETIKDQKSASKAVSVTAQGENNSGPPDVAWVLPTSNPDASVRRRAIN